jgi:lipocalin
MKYFILFAVILVVAVAQRRYPIFQRSCEERKVHFNRFAKTDFSTAAVGKDTLFLQLIYLKNFQYSGSWFEIARYQQQDEPETDCMVSRYSWGFISRSFQIDRNGRDFLREEPFTREANALIAFPDERPLRGMMNVTYYGNSRADEVNYYIIATDYFQYSVGWACENLEGTDRQF